MLTANKNINMGSFRINALLSQFNKFANLDSLFLNIFYLSFAINVLVLFFILLLQNQLPPEVPLFYQMPTGQDQLATREQLFLPSAFSFGVTLFNFIISIFIKEDFLRKALIATALVVSIFSSITTIKIMFLVGSF